ncbi:hypothetical protein, partial [Kerstersia similis]
PPIPERIQALQQTNQF